MRLINRRRHIQLSEVDWNTIKTAHQILGLDFTSDEDAKRFRAYARRAWRAESGTDDLSAYRLGTYLWFAETVCAGG